MRPVVVWAVLVAATLLSWFVTEDTQYARFGSIAVILIAAFKINLVVTYFMELKWQPAPFRLIISGWIALVTIIIIGGYLTA
jgi:heme/copper-type cytochrome/quinol oxidase subunit 4